MSRRRKRKNTPALPHPQTESPYQQSSLPLGQPQMPQTVLGRLNEKSHHFSNWAQFGGFVLGLVTLIGGVLFKFDSDKQIEILRESLETLRDSNDKQQRLEMLPRLVVECPEKPIQLNADGHLENCDIGVRIRNVGRGTAYNVCATAMYYRIDTGEPIGEARSGIKNHLAVERKTIPSGGTLDIEHFVCKLAPTKDCVGVKGMMGLYCQNEDKNSIIETQSFVLNVHMKKDDSHFHLDFITPERHPPESYGECTTNLDEVIAYLNKLTRAELFPNADTK